MTEEVDKAIRTWKHFLANGKATISQDLQELITKTIGYLEQLKEVMLK